MNITIVHLNFPFHNGTVTDRKYWEHKVHRVEVLNLDLYVGKCRRLRIQATYAFSAYLCLMHPNRCHHRNHDDVTSEIGETLHFCQNKLWFFQFHTERKPYPNSIVLFLHLFHFILFSGLQLSVNHDGIPCSDMSNCAVVAPYDGHLTLTCTSDSPGSTLEWLVFYYTLYFSK